MSLVDHPERGSAGRRRRARRGRAGRRLRARDPAVGGRDFGAGFGVTSSMEDAVVAHLASRAVPGRRRRLPRHRLPLRGDHRHPRRGRGRDGRHVCADHPRADRRRAGRRVRPEAARPRPRPVLRAAQGEPAEEGLAGYDAWATGLRRDESPTRANTPVVGWDEKRGKVKIAPIARWTQDDVDAYAEANARADQPAADGRLRLRRLRAVHPPVRARTDARAGRWAGSAKTECGIHL